MGQKDFQNISNQQLREYVVKKKKNLGGFLKTRRLSVVSLSETTNLTKICLHRLLLFLNCFQTKCLIFGNFLNEIPLINVFL